MPVMSVHPRPTCLTFPPISIPMHVMSVHPHLRSNHILPPRGIHPLSDDLGCEHPVLFQWLQQWQQLIHHISSHPGRVQFFHHPLPATSHEASHPLLATSHKVPPSPHMNPTIDSCTRILNSTCHAFSTTFWSLPVSVMTIALTFIFPPGSTSA